VNPYPAINVTRKKDGIFRLVATLCLPRTREELFPFFADAYNLEQITPPWLHFHVITPRPIKIHAGTLIDYKIRLQGIPMKWQTEITEWNPPFSFVDYQKRGPYKLWHHRHTFEEDAQGTLVRDEVDYAVVGGRIVNSLFVQSRVKKIFHFRQARLQQLFGNAGHKAPL